MSIGVSDDTVKVFFIEPTDPIKVIMNVLIKLNFEVYNVQLKDAFRLASLLKTHPRTVVYMCLLSTNDAAQWLTYVDMLQKTSAAQIQFGVFVSSIIDRSATMAFLNRGVATIDLARLKSNALETLKKILLYFEAREKRKFVRARVVGVCQAFFKFKNLQDALKGELVEISIRAFSVKMAVNDKVFFNAGEYCPEVTLLLRGKRVRIAGRFMGFDRAAPENAIFLACFPTGESGKLEYHQQLPKDARHTIYEYIELFLREDIRRELAELPETRPESETLELI
jgi:hypothetical protein